MGFVHRIIMFSKGIIARQQQPFTFSVKTDNTGTSNDDQFTLPLISGGTYNFVVDWGDGTTNTITAYNQSEITHTYSAGAGSYTIKISGILRGWAFNDGGDKSKITNISQFGILNGDVENGFYGCDNLEITATDIPIFLRLTSSLAGLFRDCTSLSNITNLEKWTSSTATSLEGFLRNAPINQNISNLITSNITNIDYAIAGTSINQDLSSGDFSGITTAVSFAFGTTMSTANYDALLISLGGQTLQSNVSFGFGSATYSIGDAATAHYDLITDNSWTITDGGLTIPDLIMWNDLADTSTITQSSGVVSAYADKSGSGNSWQQLIESARPAIGSINGVQAITFFGGNTKYMVCVNDIDINTVTIFFVYERLSGGAPYIVGSETQNLQAYRTSPSGVSSYTGTTLLTADPDTLGVAYQATLIFNNAANSRIINRDGIEIINGNYDGVLRTFNAICEANGVIRDGLNLGEMLVYDRILNSAEITAIETYLSTKWGTP